jgi:hypothetical protein
MLPFAHSRSHSVVTRPCRLTGPATFIRQRSSVRAQAHERYAVAWNSGGQEAPPRYRAGPGKAPYRFAFRLARPCEIDRFQLCFAIGHIRLKILLAHQTAVARDRPTRRRHEPACRSERRDVRRRAWLGRKKRSDGRRRLSRVECGVLAAVPVMIEHGRCGAGNSCILPDWDLSSAAHAAQKLGNCALGRLLHKRIRFAKAISIGLRSGEYRGR